MSGCWNTNNNNNRYDCWQIRPHKILRWNALHDWHELNWTDLHQVDPVTRRVIGPSAENEIGGVFFCLKSGTWGCFFVKKWKMGVFLWKVEMEVFCKNWTFPQRRVHYVQYQYFFYFAFYLFGAAYAPNAPPCLRAYDTGHARTSSRTAVQFSSVQFLCCEHGFMFCSVP